MDLGLRQLCDLRHEAVFISSIVDMFRSGLLLAESRDDIRQVILDGFKPGARARCSDVVGEGRFVLQAMLMPELLLSTQIALYPGDGDQGPDGGPDEWKGPSQL